MIAMCILVKIKMTHTDNIRYYKASNYGMFWTYTVAIVKSILLSIIDAGKVSRRKLTYTLVVKYSRREARVEILQRKPGSISSDKSLTIHNSAIHTSESIS